MRGDSERYNLRAIRDLLLDAFNADELQELFYFARTPELRAAGLQFREDDSLPVMVRKAVRYCDSRSLLKEMLAEVKAANPRKYQQHEPSLHLSVPQPTARDAAAEAAEHEAQLERERQEREAGERRQAEQARAEQMAGLVAVGKGHLLEGKWWLAGQAFRQALALAPDDAEAIAGLTEAERREQSASRLVAGQDRLRAGRWSEALSCFQDVLEIEPAHPDATKLLAEAQAQERQEAEARAKREEEDRQAERARQEAVRKASREEAARQAELARLYNEACVDAVREDWSQAIDRFAQLLRIDPEYRDAADRMAKARAALRAREEQAGHQVRPPTEKTADGQVAQGGFDWNRWASNASSEGATVRPATSKDLQEVLGADTTLSEFFDQVFAGAAPAQERTGARPAVPAGPVAWRTAALLTLVPNTGSFKRAAFSPDCSLVVTCGEDKKARVWEARTGRRLGDLGGHEERVNSAAFSPDGTLVVTASDDGRAQVFRVVPLQWVAKTKRHGAWLGMGWRAVIGAAFLPDGSLVATTASDGKVRMWEPATAKFKGELDGEDAFAVRAYCSPGGQGLLMVHKDGWGRVPKDIQTGRLWTALRQTEMGKFVAALTDETLLAVPEPSFSADSKRAITGHDNGLARVWEVATGTLVRELDVSKGSPVRAVAFHPNGRWVATVAASDARVWDVESAEVVAELRGHESLVNSVAFSADGKQAMTASDDGTARVWEVP